MRFKVCLNEIYLGPVTNTNIVLCVISARSNPSNVIARSDYLTWISSLQLFTIFYLCGNPPCMDRLKNRVCCSLDEFWLRYRGRFLVAVGSWELAMVLTVGYKGAKHTESLLCWTLRPTMRRQDSQTKSINKITSDGGKVNEKQRIPWKRVGSGASKLL